MFFTLFLVRLAFVPLVINIGFTHAKLEFSIVEIPPSKTTDVASRFNALQFSNSESLIVTFPFAYIAPPVPPKAVLVLLNVESLTVALIFLR